MENPIKMDDLGGPPLFLEIPKWEKSSYILKPEIRLIWWLPAFFLGESLQGKFSTITAAYKLLGEGNMILGSIACFWHVQYIQQPRCKIMFQAKSTNNWSVKQL